MTETFHDFTGKTVVLTYGTFDVLHIGHINLLRRLKDLGDILIVGVSTDEFNAQKNKTSFQTYEERSQIVASLRYVDLVIPEYSWDQKVQDIKKYNVSIFGMGSDWEGKFDYLSDHCKVIYLPRTPDIDSSSFRQFLSGLRTTR